MVVHCPIGREGIERGAEPSHAGDAVTPAPDATRCFQSIIINSTPQRKTGMRLACSIPTLHGGAA